MVDLPFFTPLPPPAELRRPLPPSTLRRTLLNCLPLVFTPVPLRYGPSTEEALRGIRGAARVGRIKTGPTRKTRTTEARTYLRNSCRNVSRFSLIADSAPPFAVVRPIRLPDRRGQPDGRFQWAPLPSAKCLHRATGIPWIGSRIAPVWSDCGPPCTDARQRPRHGEVRRISQVRRC